MVVRFAWERYATTDEQQSIALIDGMLKRYRGFVLRLVGKRQRIVNRIRGRVKG